MDLRRSYLAFLSPTAAPEANAVECACSMEGTSESTMVSDLDMFVVLGGDNINISACADVAGNH